MRPTRSLIVLSAALALSLLSGCLPKTFINPEVNTKRPTEPTKATPDSLVRYLNTEARKLNSLKAQLAADVSSPDGAVALSGNIACEKPRGFRMTAVAFGSPAVDIGSNDKEFWFWARPGARGTAPLLYCSYRDLATGKVRVPFPFQPDMVLVALGMAPYDVAGKYTLKDNMDENKLELSLETAGLDGRPITRTVVFRRNEATTGQAQVVGHLLKDQKGDVICKAEVLAVTEDPRSKAKVPTKVKISWPSQKASITLMLSYVQTNALTPDQASGMFTRTSVPGRESRDLATWRPSASSMARRGR